jgi:hypothetical protein
VRSRARIARRSRPRSLQILRSATPTPAGIALAPRPSMAPRSRRTGASTGPLAPSQRGGPPDADREGTGQGAQSSATRPVAASHLRWCDVCAVLRSGGLLGLTWWLLPHVGGCAAQGEPSPPPPLSITSGAPGASGGTPSPGPSAPPPAASSVIDLPGGGVGIGLDDLRFSPRLGRIISPAGRTGAVDLIDPASGAVTSVTGFTSSATFDGSDQQGGSVSARREAGKQARREGEGSASHQFPTTRVSDAVRAHFGLVRVARLLAPTLPELGLSLETILPK